MSVLLDTNAYVAFRRGDSSLADIIAGSDGVAMSTVVVGELIFGFRNGSRYQENMDSLRSFLAEPEVSIVPVSFATAERYGSVSVALRSAGRPIPTNDVWIAAQALELGIPVVSFDTHFRSVPGIDLIDPAS